MKNRIALSVGAASLVFGGAAYAGTINGSSGNTVISADDDDQKQRRNRNQRARSRSEAATSTSGAAITTRRGGAAAIDTRGHARGDGSVQSNSEGEVYSSTDRDGSQADAYGRSDASADEPRRRRPQ